MKGRGRRLARQEACLVYVKKNKSKPKPRGTMAATSTKSCTVKNVLELGLKPAEALQNGKPR